MLLAYLNGARIRVANSSKYFRPWVLIPREWLPVVVSAIVRVPGRRWGILEDEGQQLTKTFVESMPKALQCIKIYSGMLICLFACVKQGLVKLFLP